MNKYDKLKLKYFELYGHFGANENQFNSLIRVIEENINHSKSRGKKEHDWFMKEDMIGMMLYVDLFGKDFKGVTKHIPYLKKLGITYVHLMPLLKSRDGENDGGYAVEDYLNVNPEYGTLEEFHDLIKSFNRNKIEVCIDYVLNHTSDTHEWAKKALAGDEFYQDMYMMYDTREIPDLYDQTVSEVLPVKCPGNFTYVEQIKKHVFTSFSHFQWDLNFKNPYVFEQMVETMLKLANMGIGILRLDAIAFMWKETNTSCRNLEHAHQILHLFHLIKEIACPSLTLLGEAIVEPHEIVKYFGEEETECDLLYNANLMVDIFNSFATRDVRLMQYDNTVLKAPKTGCFMNYIRCHDDIGWGFNEPFINRIGFDSYHHKQFLINFYNGTFNGSFATGENYQYNEKTHDTRTNGTLASLLGLESAERYQDQRARETALYRIKLANALIFSHRGIPLIYSGDELATLNDHTYLNDIHKKDEARWVHRPIFDWERAKKRKDMTTDEGIIFQFIKRLIKLRKSEPLFSGTVDAKVIDVHNQHVYAFLKADDTQQIVCLFNFSENNQYFSNKTLQSVRSKTLTDMITGKNVSLEKDVHLYPYECLWLK